MREFDFFLSACDKYNKQYPIWRFNGYSVKQAKALYRDKFGLKGKRGLPPEVRIFK